MEVHLQFQLGVISSELVEDADDDSSGTDCSASGSDTDRVNEGVELIQASHLGSRKVIATLIRVFSWPCMSHDVENFVSSSDLCQRNNRAGNEKAPMVERPIVT